MRQYLDLMQHVLDHGTKKEDRTGTGTLSVFGHQMRFDLAEGFPLLTTKKVFLKGIIHELLWFLAGDTNIKYLVDNGVGIWNEWPHAAYVKSTGDNIPLAEFVARIRDDAAFAKQWGDIGPGYGHQWRSWPKPDGGHIDQISQVVNQIKRNPDSRRLIGLQLGATDLARLLERVVAREQRAREEVRARLTGLDEPIVVRADEELLERAFENVVRNAVEAAARGGGHVDVAARDEGGQVEVLVEDDGPGLAPDHPGTIRPFYTTRPGGLGLGLPLARKIVVLHGGAIELEGREPGGARVTVRLPAGGPQSGLFPDGG